MKRKRIGVSMKENIERMATKRREISAAWHRQKAAARIAIVAYHRHRSSIAQKQKKRGREIREGTGGVSSAMTIRRAAHGGRIIIIASASYHKVWRQAACAGIGVTPRRSNAEAWHISKSLYAWRAARALRAAGEKAARLAAGGFRV